MRSIQFIHIFLILITTMWFVLVLGKGLGHITNLYDVIPALTNSIVTVIMLAVYINKDMLVKRQVRDSDKQ